LTSLNGLNGKTYPFWYNFFDVEKFLNHQLVYQNPPKDAFGRVLLAGHLDNKTGRPAHRMRVLGSYGLVYLTAGSGTLMCDGRPPIRLSVGDLIMLFPNVPHQYGPGSDDVWSEFYIVFEGTVFDRWRKQGLIDPQEPIVRLTPVDYWLRRLKEAISQPGMFVSQVPLVMISRLQELLAEVIVRRQADRLDREDQEWLHIVSQRINKVPLHEPMDWPELARQVGMGYESFRKRFAAAANMPPTRYRSQQVIEEACRLIAIDRLSVTQTAERLGFPNPFYFSRRFKQITGYPPTDFKRKLPQNS
jgi:AraC-like DNA-binding protein